MPLDYSRNRKRLGGFTLIELLLILWVLSLMSMHRYQLSNDYWESRAIERTATGFKLFEQMARHYKKRYGGWPISPELAAQHLGLNNVLYNRNAFGHSYRYDLQEGNTKLTILTRTNTSYQAMSICKRHTGITCSDRDMRLTVSEDALRLADNLVQSLLSGNQRGLDARGHYLLNVGSINSNKQNVLDLRVPNAPGQSQLALYSIDAREIIVDDAFVSLIDDAETLYNEFIHSKYANNPVNRRSNYHFFPQSRYPIEWPR